jgi:hypothetical protein
MTYNRGGQYLYIVSFIVSDVTFAAIFLLWRVLEGVAGIPIYFFNFVDRETYLLAYLVFFNLYTTATNSKQKTVSDVTKMQPRISSCTFNLKSFLYLMIWQIKSLWDFWSVTHNLFKSLFVFRIFQFSKF